MTGARFGIPTEAGEAPPVAGLIHSQSQATLTPSYLGQGLFFDAGSRDQEKIPETLRRIALAVSDVPRVRLRVSVICFVGVVVP